MFFPWEMKPLQIDFGLQDLQATQAPWFGCLRQNQYPLGWTPGVPAIWEGPKKGGTRRTGEI